MRFSNHIFIVLALGLAWLGCEIPVSPLPNVGDEIRLTNDPGSNRDPFWYTEGDPETLEGSQICYHDGRTIYLYDWDSGAISELYTATEGYEITTLDKIMFWSHGKGYAFALHGEGQTVVVAIMNDELEVELLRDSGPPIESMFVNYYDEDDMWNENNFALVISRNKEIYVLYTDGSDDDSKYAIYICDGYDVSNYGDMCYLIRGEGESTSIWEFSFLSFDLISRFNDGSLNRYPQRTLCVTDKGDTRDIWNYFIDYRVTTDEGEEKELDINSYYVVFNRVDDGQSDIYVARWVEQ